MATQASDAPINLGYAGNGYAASGSGVLSFNPPQTGTVDLGTITINGLVTDVTKAKIGVGQTQNIYLATGVTSIDQGSAATPVSDLSEVQLTTNDVLFSMSGLTYSGNSLLASVSRRAAQAAMPMLPKELAGIVDGYTPGTNAFMDSAVTKGSSAAQAVTSASYASSVGAGGMAAVSTNTQNVGAISARASGQAMTPGSVNPIAVAPSLQNMPQVHLSSAVDTIMPPEISERFCRAAQQPLSCRVVKGVQHGGKWQKIGEYREKSENINR